MLLIRENRTVHHHCHPPHVFPLMCIYVRSDRVTSSANASANASMGASKDSKKEKKSRPPRKKDMEWKPLLRRTASSMG